MASLVLALLAAILPSMSLAANTSANMPGQGLSLVVTPDDDSFGSFFPTLVDIIRWVVLSLVCL